jgi:hypothetical protein
MGSYNADDAVVVVSGVVEVSPSFLLKSGMTINNTTRASSQYRFFLYQGRSAFDFAMMDLASARNSLSSDISPLETIKCIYSFALGMTI